MAVIGIFLYAKGKGKEEAKSEANKKIIDNIEKRHKIDAANRNKPDDTIIDEMHDPNAD